MEIIYTSCACNRTPTAADWGFSNIIAYAAAHGIAICNPKLPAVVKQILSGNASKVICVKWIQIRGANRQQNLPEEELVAGSSDNTSIVWRKQTTGQFVEACRLIGHEGTVTTVDAISIINAENSKQISGSGYQDVSLKRTVIATASVDSTVKLWERQEGEEHFNCFQTLRFGTGFALDVALTILPHSEVLMLACAGDDQRIHIFIEQDSEFVSVQTLLGHEDWVRGLSFAYDNNGDVLLASCSQDYYIRLWRFSLRDLEDQSTISVSQLSIQDDIKLKENTFTFKSSGDGESGCYAVALESVLQGHENWVYSVRWQPSQIIDGKLHQPMCLLSASMDKTMIIWKPEPQSGIWLEHARVGEVGGNSLGFYGGLWSPDGRSILSHGYQGAFELRTFNQEKDTWEPQVTCGGHFSSVQDIVWQPETGHFLLSVSVDQTTRCHGYWNSPNDKERSWHEVARPQIHGYDMQCITMINRYSYVSGADEKVIRCFEAPQNFVLTFSRISGLNLSKDIESRPQGAAVPCLGLSNKAVFEDSAVNVLAVHDVESHPNEQYPEHYFIPVDTHQPPSEVDLLQNTLWPEVHKLYGHGYEIFALACNPQGTVLASSCRAAKAEHAGVMLWSCLTWKHLQTLDSHSLTVTQLQFSHSGKYLLSVSRDRTWSLFSKKDSDIYDRIAYTDKKTCVHSRIIWGCAWSNDDKYFVTVSRDKKAVIWGLDNTKDASVSSVAQYVVCASLTLSDSITAVDFAPVDLPQDRYMLAFGYDSGNILLYTWQLGADEPWTHITTLSTSESHHLTVKRLKFRPVSPDIKSSFKGSSNDLQLASCGADHIVRIYNINRTLL